MESDDLEFNDFIESYQPKNSEKVLKSYLKQPKLSDYNILKPELYADMIVGKTYIKYIDNVYSYDLKVHSGGILISGGTYTKKGYKETSKVNLWTHLMLKNINSDNGEYIFTIKISNHHIFYKLFIEEINRREIKKMIIEIIKK